MLAFLTRVAAALFVVAVPITLVLTVIRLLVFDPAYYQRGYLQHGVTRTTGMTQAQLTAATAQIQAYFRGGPPVLLVVEKERGQAPLFNDREQQHLADVRDLLGLALWVQVGSLGYLLGATVYLLAFRRSDGARMLAQWLSAGAGLTLALFAGLGSLALTDFSSFWTQLHKLSFRNDLWMLDPRTDYMIRLYPIPFWSDAVVDVILRSGSMAVALLILGQGYLRWPTGEQTAPALAVPARRRARRR